MFFLVVLTFITGTSSLKDYAVSCKDQACVEKVEAGVFDSPNLRRLQVYDSRNPYAPLSVSGKPQWPPMTDWTFQ